MYGNGESGQRLVEAQSLKSALVSRGVGRLVARGNTSDVYEWDGQAVVKVLREGVPSSWAEIEATTIMKVRRAGLPAPAILGMVTVGRRPGIILERIAGMTLEARLARYPDESSRLLDMLVSLQAELNSICVPGLLPSLKDRLQANIARATLLTAPRRRTVLALLAGLSDGGAVCHFDFHPRNVLLGPDGPVIIDWFDAACGTPAADLVRTSLLMCYGAAQAHDVYESRWMPRVHVEYLARAVRGSVVDEESMLAWEPIVTAARLAEPISDELRRLTYDDLSRALDGGSRLAGFLRSIRVAA